MLEKIINKIKEVDTPMAPSSYTPQPPKEEAHQHEWQPISKTYAAPRRALIEGLEGEVLEHALFGVTTILWECVICKQLRKAYSLGSDKSELDELLDKTETYGPQYIQRDGVTYVLSRYQVQQQPMVPLK